MVNVLQNDSVQGHIADLAEHGFSFGEIKSQFGRVYGIDLGFIESLEELTNPSALESKQEKIEAKIEEVQAKYLKARNEAIRLHRESVFEQDKQTREYLQFITDLGFDFLPKEITDQLISEV